MTLRAIWQFTDWTAQSVNCILPEITSFICYIYGLIKRYSLITSTKYFINQQMLNIKGLK